MDIYIDICPYHQRHPRELVALLKEREKPENGSEQKNGNAEKRGRGRQPGTKFVDAQETLEKVKEKVLREKVKGTPRGDVKSNLIASQLYIGSKERGGDAMMRRLKNNGLKMDWPTLRDHIWDGGEVDGLLKTTRI